MPLYTSSPMQPDQKYRELVMEMYKDPKGNPLYLTDSQLILFELIFTKKYPRTHVMAYTRSGKSYTIATAVLTRLITFPEKWAVVAPTEKQARVIMGYIIEHAIQNPIASAMLQEKGEKLDRLRKETSKLKLTFKHPDGRFSEIAVYSIDARNERSAGNAVMGLGASHLIIDESALIPDVMEAKIFRMLGDSMDNFYLKIGNPSKKNHFYKSYLDPRWFKFQVDADVGLTEKTYDGTYRITQDYLDEASTKPGYEMLYFNKFPDESEMQDGWIPLLVSSELDRALERGREQFINIGEPILGVDVAHGGDDSVWVIRFDNVAHVVHKAKTKSIMDVVAMTTHLAEEWKVLDANINIDDTGMGNGVTDRLRELGKSVNGVRVAMSPQDAVRFTNKKAENAWRVREWVLRGNGLGKGNWDDVSVLAYKVKDSGTSAIQIISKDEILKAHGFSPDTFDALALTFDKMYPITRQVLELEKKERQKEPAYMDRYSVI